MSEEEKTDSGSSAPYTRLGITPEDAAAASIAQAMAFAAQNEVDAFRNQNTVAMVAMGSAYAKWLQNPMMANEFAPIVASAEMNSVEQPHDDGQPVFKSMSQAQPKPGSRTSYLLPSKIFSLFMSPPDSDTN